MLPLFEFEFPISEFLKTYLIQAAVLSTNAFVGRRSLIRINNLWPTLEREVQHGFQCQMSAAAVVCLLENTFLAFLTWLFWVMLVSYLMKINSWIWRWFDDVKMWWVHCKSPPTPSEFLEKYLALTLSGSCPVLRGEWGGGLRVKSVLVKCVCLFWVIGARIGLVG